MFPREEQRFDLSSCLSIIFVFCFLFSCPVCYFFFAIIFVFQTEIAVTKPPGVFNGQLNLFAFSYTFIPNLFG